ncbi:hypothetical protein AB0I60_00630 [Actinosynnema sp. NPDC050436]|uniref:hypothetical protein n=1 Tax=Actinosynnema sp. NPDC050436 TaxID=3155659 RepID=UPI0033D69103
MRAVPDAERAAAVPGGPAVGRRVDGVRAHPLAALQRAAGNRAVSGLVQTVQRCGGEVHPGCSCAEEANRPAVQRKAPGAAKKPHKGPPRPALGSCHPVQDDLRPTAPWADLQRGYRSRCESTVGGAVDDLLHGRVPRPDPRSTVDCMCAVGDPRTVAVAAMARVLAAGPLAAALFWHFLGASGSEVTIDVADMIARSGGVREKIRRSTGAGGTSGTTRLEQSDYRDADLQFAYGAIDCVQWIVQPPVRRNWRRDGTTRIEVKMLDYYEFHPARPGVSQCAHAACVELVARGGAKNFWTRGSATVTWARLRA